MSDQRNLTPDLRAELRQLLDDHTTDAGEWCCDVLPQAAMDALPALLDAADERDRLAAAIERIEHDARCPHPKCPGHGMCCCPEAKP